MSGSGIGLKIGENFGDNPTQRPLLVKQIFAIIAGIDGCKNMPLKDWDIS